jgi:DNA-binding XRE family transcriptional regulator
MGEHKNWKEMKQDLLKDDKVKKEYEALRPQYELIEQVIKARIELGLTQAELAKKIGMKQSNISRFESGEYNPSIEFLSKIATGLNKTINIQLTNR